jgi:hypothetical protein
MPSTLRRTAFAAFAFVLACSAAFARADGASAQMRVSAVVRPYLRMQVVSQPHTIDVSARDIARGYVDVPIPVQLAVESNSRDGCTIVFARNGDFVREAQVRGLGQELQVAQEGFMHWTPNARRETLQFQFRLQLAPQVSPGQYPWPIQVSLSGL